MWHDIDHAVEVVAKKVLDVGFDGGQRIIDIDVAESALMGGDDDVGHRPEPMLGRQRLLAEDIERRAGDAIFGQRRNERGLIDHSAAGEIDEIARRLHRRKYRSIDAVARGWGERRQQNEEVEIADDSRKLLAAVHTVEAGKDRKSTRLNSSHLGISYA